MAQSSSTSGSNLTFLQGGGEMGGRMRDLDWVKTSLGPPDNWPQSLRSTLSMLLPSKAQIVLFWSPEFIVFYNDAYRPVFGAKHPHALGLPGREAWSEIWDGKLHELLAGVRSPPTSGCRGRTDIRSFAPSAVSRQAREDPFLLSRLRLTRPCENVRKR
jgi:hypothetical protein